MATTEYRLSQIDAEDLLKCFDSQGRLIGLSGMKAKGNGKYLSYSKASSNNGLRQSIKQALDTNFYPGLVKNLLELRFTTSPVSASGNVVYFTQEAIERTKSLVDKIFVS